MARSLPPSLSSEPSETKAPGPATSSTKSWGRRGRAPALQAVLRRDSRLKLEPFQERIVREVFSARREALILLPRGNGKSTLLAAVALWHLLRTREPRIAIGAASREQAATLFDIARGMASHPAIASRVEITRREIRTPAGWLALLEWSLPDSASIDDMTAVKKVNPASWLNEGDLAEQREAVHEGAFRRYHANQWVAGVDSAISATEWAACAAPGCEIPEGPMRC